MNLGTILAAFRGNNPINAIFATLLISSVPFLINQDEFHERTKNKVKVFSNLGLFRNKNHQTFDYIVVGSGSAGAVVANRLSANHKVLLLEAGGTPSPISEIPFFKPYLEGTFLWHTYKTVPQKYMGFAYKNHVQVIPRGRALGGSGQVNAMMYVRGNRLDYEKLVDLVGDSAFSYENVLKVYKKQEDYHGAYPNPKYHGTGGELYIEPNPYVPKIGKYLIEGLKEKNIMIGDYNGDFHGPIWSRPEVLIKNGRRWGAYRGFLEPILSRKTLSIYKFSYGTKILMDSTGKAYGVEYVRHGLKFKAYASKEVIISAGVIESPKLLMLSGIGDSKDLKSVGINPVVDLPGVGKNYVEAPSVDLYILTNESYTFVNNRDLSPKFLKEYLNNGTGPFSCIAFRPVVGYTNSMDNTPKSYPKTWNILEANGIPEKLDSAKGPKFHEYFKDYQGKDGILVDTLNYELRSAPGEIKLKSKDYKDPPIIDPNYFNNPADFESYIDAINFLADLFENTKALSSTGAHLIPKKFPGCESHKMKSREYWKCYIQQAGTTGIQSYGTCKMGKKTDPKTVVDSDFRVLKTKNLRVIDASVFPFYLTGNPHAETMMLGDIGSEKILNGE